MPVYPQPNLDPNAAPWGRSVNARLDTLETAADRVAQENINVNKQQNSTSTALASQIKTLADTVASLQSITAKLQSVAILNYMEFTTGLTDFTGWYPGTAASVKVTSVTGRLELNYGGSLNGGSGYFVASITNATTGAVVLSRDTGLNNPAQRVAVSGGASFAPSGYKTLITNVPIDTPLTVKLELNAQDSFTYFMGGSILVRDAL